MNKQEEKRKIISEYLSGATSTRKLAVKYGYGHVTISRWIMSHQKKPKNQPLKLSKAIMKSGDLLPTSVAELQEALRLSQLKVELLEAMIDISDEQFGTDIRKKAGTRQS